MKIRKLFILICLALFVSSSDQQGQKDVKLYQKTQNLENKAESLPKQIDAIKTEATINSIITSATPRIDYELLGVVCKAGNCGLDDGLKNCGTQCGREFPRRNRNYDCCVARCLDRLGPVKSKPSAPPPACQFNAPPEL